MCLPNWGEFRAKSKVLQDVLASDSQTSALLREEPRLNEEEAWGKGNVHISRLRTYTTLPLHSPLQRNKAWIFIIPIYQGWNQGRREREFPRDWKGTGGKAKFTLKSFTGSQDYVNTTTLVFPNRRVLPHNCFSNTAKDIELGVQGSRRREAEKGRQAEFQIFGVYL